MSLQFMLAATESAAEEAGRQFGFLLWTVVCVIGLIKCISIARRPRTSTVCVVALTLVLTTWLTTQFLRWLMNSMEFDRATRLGFGGIILILILSSIILAIVGLAQYKNSQHEYNQGRSQAVWAIILGMILFSAFGYGFTKGLRQLADSGGVPQIEKTDSAAGTWRTFEDVNCRMQVPKKPWVELNAKALNEDGRFALLRNNPKVMFTLIAENGAGSIDLDAAGYAELLQSNVRAIATSVDISDLDSSPHGKLPFKRFEAAAKLPNVPRKIFYDFHILTHNGFYYQLLTWGQIEDTQEVREQARSVLKHFEILDPDRLAENDALALEDIRSQPLGFATSLAGTKWFAWEEIDADQPGMQFGALNGAHGRFVIEAVPLGDLDPDRDDLVHGMISRHGLSWPDDAVSVVPIELENTDSACEVRTRQELEGFNFDYRIRIIRRGDMAYALTAWVSTKQKDAESLFGEAFNAIEFFDRSGTDSPTPLALDGRQTVLNQTGLAAYRREEYEEAITLFKAAYETRRNDPVVLGNVCEAAYRSGSYEDGLTYLKQHMDRHPDDLQLKDHLAYLTGAKGDLDAAKSLFQSVIDEGYENDDDLLRALNLYVDADRSADAIPLVESYFKHHPSSKIWRWKGSMYARAGQFDKAIEDLKQLVKDHPNDIEALFTLAETCNDGEDYAGAEEFAKQLVTKGYDNSRAALIKGWSEYNRKWYQRARETFKTALEKDKDNPNLKSALRSASSALGKGDNVAASKPIDAVPIPSLVAEIIKKASSGGKPGTETVSAGFGAVYRSVITGIRYKKGEVQRTTARAKVKVLDRSGVNRFSTLEFLFDPLSERIYINELKVLDADGKVVGEGNLDDYFLTDEGDVEADHDQVLSAPVPGLKKGHELHYTVTRETLSPMDEPDFQRRVFSRTLPQGMHCFFLSGDTKAIRHSKSPRISEQSEGEVIAWSMTDIPAYSWETMQPDISTFLPTVVVGSKEQSWKKLGSEYLDRISDKLELDDEIRSLAKRLAGDKPDTNAKIGALSKFVRGELEYKAIEFGVRGRVPNKASQILKDKYGDCKDHSLLLYQLLEASDIPAQLALVNTSWKIHDQLQSIDQFNHMIVYLPDESRIPFIDCTDKYVPSHSRLPPAYLGGHSALVLDPKNSALKKISEYPANIDLLDIKRKVSITSNTDALVEETVKFHGYDASAMRSYIAGIDAINRDKRVHDLISGDHHLHLDRLEIKELENPEVPLQMVLKYRIGQVFEQQNGTLKATVPCLWERYYLNPTHVKDRRNPFVIDHEFTVKSDVELKLDRTIPASLPDSLSASRKGELCKWEIRANTGGTPDRLRIHSEIFTGAGRFEAARYSTYESERRAAVKALTLRFDLPKQDSD